MQQPNRLVTSNLRWTRSGVVWADYVLTGIPYGYRPIEDRQTARSIHYMFLLALPGESLLLSVAVSLDPMTIVERMEREGVVSSANHVGKREVLARDIDDRER